MASSHVITFAPDGTAQCVWNEAVPLQKLWILQVHRLSTIEFNQESQHWEVRNQCGSVRFFSKSRDKCLEWERRNPGELLCC